MEECSESPSLPWKYECSLDPLSCETEMNNEIDLKPPNFSLTVLKCEDVSPVDCKEELICNNSIGFDHNINSQCGASQDILKELVPVYRENFDLKKIINPKCFIFDDLINQKVHIKENICEEELMSEEGNISEEGHMPEEGNISEEGHMHEEGNISEEGHMPEEGNISEEGHMPEEGNISEEDINIQQHSNLKSLSSVLEDKDIRLEHFSSERVKNNEGCSSVVITCDRLTNSSQPHEECLAHDEDTCNDTDPSQPQESCFKCHRIECDCHNDNPNSIDSIHNDKPTSIDTIHNDKPTSIDSICKCYKCRRQSYMSKRRNWKCDKCEKIFHSKKYLDRHTKSNCNFLKPFICNICVKGFSCPFSLRHHNFAFHVKETGIHQCSDCERQFPNQFLLHKHKLRCKKNSGSLEYLKPRVVCEFCQKTFGSKNTLTVHCKRLHNPEKEFICAHCKERFSHKTLLVVHMQTRHSSERVSCEMCHISYKSQFSLSKHILIKHMQNKGKKYMCETCGKGFIVIEKLKRHLAVHSGEKPFVCDLCGKCFRVSSNLQQHLVTHSDIRPFTCDICGSAFRIRNHLRQHMAVHGLVNTSTKRKRKQ